MIVVLQTPMARHLENRVYRTAEVDLRAGHLTALCGALIDSEDTKRVRVDRIPAAAVCPDCTLRARRWYADWWFEPFDRVQRQRLLDNLTRDLEATLG